MEIWEYAAMSAVAALFYIIIAMIFYNTDTKDFPLLTTYIGSIVAIVIAISLAKVFNVSSVVAIPMLFSALIGCTAMFILVAISQFFTRKRA